MNDNIIFRLAILSDVDEILEVITQAQMYLKTQKIDQWQNNYPNREIIINDINNNNSYVLELEGRIVATTAIIFEVETTYNKIYKGQWLSNKDYVTIHRIAVDNQHKGKQFGKLIIDATEQLALQRNFKSIRVDTHQDNLVMQKFLLKNKFLYCGIIYLADGSERLAYEKVIN